MQTMQTFYFSLCSSDSKPQADKIITACESYLEAECILAEQGKNLTPEIIRENLANCDALIVVFGKEDISLPSSTSTVREQLLPDRIRWEIISAIHLDLLIVPLFLDQAKIPEKQQGALKHLLKYKSYRLRNASWNEDLHKFLHDIECEMAFNNEVARKLALSNRPDYRPAIKSDEQTSRSAQLQLGHSSKAFEVNRIIDTERFNLEEARRKGNRISEKNALSALALAFTRLQQTRRAIQFFQEQLEIVRELGETEEECDVLANLGDALAVLGNIEHAKSFYQEQLMLAESRGFRRFVGSALNGLGFVHVKQNNIHRAIECYLQALAIYRELENHDKELELLVGIGLNYQKQGGYRQAIDYLEQALKSSRYLENRREETCILLDLVEASYYIGKTDRAHSCLLMAEELLNGLEDPWVPSQRKRLQILRDKTNYQ
jgi:tetratricopeptide (TPR) repeat protein